MAWKRADARRRAMYCAASRVRRSLAARSPCGMAMTDSVAMMDVASSSSIRLKPLFGRRTGSLGLLGDRQHRLQLEEALFADPFDVHQVFHLLEVPVLLPVLDDAL